MKTLLKFMCVAMLAVVFSSCSKEDPESIAVDFTKAIYSGNFDKAASYCTDEANATLQLSKSMFEGDQKKLSEMKKATPEVKVVSSSIKEDVAKVTVSIKNFYDPEKSKVVDVAETEDVDLKKVDGNWKVYIDK